MHKCFLIILLSMLWPASAIAELRINEFMASNDSIILDDDGENSDWIEIFNSAEPVDLANEGFSATPPRQAPRTVAW